MTSMPFWNLTSWTTLGEFIFALQSLCPAGRGVGRRPPDHHRGHGGRTVPKKESAASPMPGGGMGGGDGFLIDPRSTQKCEGPGEIFDFFIFPDLVRERIYITAFASTQNGGSNGRFQTIPNLIRGRLVARCKNRGV